MCRITDFTGRGVGPTSAVLGGGDRGTMFRSTCDCYPFAAFRERERRNRMLRTVLVALAIAASSAMAAENDEATRPRLQSRNALVSECSANE